MNNRIIANAGTNLAGGIGIFAGADGYVDQRQRHLRQLLGRVRRRREPVYGLSPNGSIDHNRIYYNQCYDEGGGIMIAGQLPTDPSILSPGLGRRLHPRQPDPGQPRQRRRRRHPVPDGRGCNSSTRCNRAARYVYNNMIVNNVSTHEGGGIALDDAPNVRIYNNTIMKNVTTATAVTSNGQPAPAGLSTGAEQRRAPGDAARRGSPAVQQPAPVQQHPVGQPGRARNVRAPSPASAQPGDATPINLWDIGAFDGSGLLAPTNSIVQQNAGTHPVHDEPDQQRRRPARRRRLRHGARLRAVADQPELRRRDPGRGGPAAQGPRRLPPPRHHLAGVQHRARRARRCPAYAQPPATLTAPADRHRRPAAARPGRLRHRRGRDPARPSPTSRSPRPTAWRP